MWTLSYTDSYMVSTGSTAPRSTTGRTSMSDRYQDFVSSSLGQVLVKNLGLPNPVRLDRYVAGSPLVDGTVAVGGTGRLVEHLPGVLDTLGIESTTSPEPGERYQGLVLDATGLTD